MEVENKYNEKVEKVIRLVYEIHACGKYPSIREVGRFFKSYLSSDLNKVRKQ